jgi:hypothetical protein
MLIRMDFLEVLADFLLNNDSPNLTKSQRRFEMVDRLVDPPVKDLIITMSILVRSCQISKIHNNCTAPLHMGGTTLLTKTSLKMLRSKPMVRRLIRDRIAPVASGQILSHLVWNNAEMDTMVFKSLMDWIDRLPDLADVIEFIIDPLLQLRDTLRDQRLANFCNEVLMGNFFAQKDSNPMWSFELVAYCARLITFPDRQLHFILCDHWDDIKHMYMWIENNLWTHKQRRAMKRKSNPAATQKSAHELQDEDFEDEYYGAL